MRQPNLTKVGPSAFPGADYLGKNMFKNIEVTKVPFDTLKLAITLRNEAGLPQRQAEGMTKVLADAVRCYRATNGTSSGPSFDTLKLALGLHEKAGFSRENAETVACAIAESCHPTS